MKGEFIDLCIEKIDEPMAKLLVLMGYKAAAVLEYEEKTGRIDKLFIIRCKLLRSRKESSLRKALRGIKGEYPIVLVEPMDIQSARFAGRDSRIDGILIGEASLRVIDRAQISLMKQYSKPLILPMKIFYNMDSRRKAMVYRRIAYAYDRGVNIIPVSYASEIYDILIPQSITKLLEHYFGINNRYWLYMLTSGVGEILVKNGVRV